MKGGQSVPFLRELSRQAPKVPKRSFRLIESCLPPLASLQAEVDVLGVEPPDEGAVGVERGRLLPREVVLADHGVDLLERGLLLGARV